MLKLDSQLCVKNKKSFKEITIEVFLTIVRKIAVERGTLFLNTEMQLTFGKSKYLIKGKFR